MTLVNGKWTFCVLAFDHIFAQMVSMKVKELSNSNLAASRHIERVKVSFPGDVRCSKTHLLKLPIAASSFVRGQW